MDRDPKQIQIGGRTYQQVDDQGAVAPKVLSEHDGDVSMARRGYPVRLVAERPDGTQKPLLHLTRSGALDLARKLAAAGGYREPSSAGAALWITVAAGSTQLPLHGWVKVAVEIVCMAAAMIGLSRRGRI